MKNRKLILPIVVTGVLVLSAFIPILQIIILSLNGGLLSLVETILGAESTLLLYSVNTVFSVLFVVLYYLSEKMVLRILTAIGFVFFYLPLLLYVSEDLLIDESLYFLRFMLVGFAVGFTLILVNYGKKKL